MKIKTESKLGNKEYKPKVTIYQSSNEKLSLQELYDSIESARIENINDILEYDIMREHFINHKHLITVDEENCYTWNKDALLDLNFDQSCNVYNQCKNLLEWYERDPLFFQEFYNELLDRRGIKLDI